MTHDLIIDKRVMDCFTHHGIHLESSEVFTLVGDFTIKKITDSLARLRSDNRVSFKRIGKGYVYWVDVVNIEPEPASWVQYIPQPVIGSDVSYSAWGHFSAFITKLSWWQVVAGATIVFLPWILMANSWVN